jgi:hypothetical protein
MVNIFGVRINEKEKTQEVQKENKTKKIMYYFSLLQLYRSYSYYLSFSNMSIVA